MAQRKVITDAENPQQLKEVAREQDDDARDLYNILRTVGGRRFMYQLIHDTCHVNGMSLIPDSPVSTGFNEGARSIGVSLIQTIKADHFSAYVQMLEENENG